MTIQIVASSPIADELAKNPSAVDKPKRQAYPFNQLGVGQSFTISTDQARIKSLQLIARRKSVDGKKYTVIEHASPAVVEVARIQ